jgi:hypothetical protein
VVEGVDRGAQLVARPHALAGTPQPGTVGEAGAGGLVDVGRLVVQAQRDGEMAVGVIVGREQAPAAGRPGERPRLGLGGGGALVAFGGPGGGRAPPDTEV